MSSGGSLPYSRHAPPVAFKCRPCNKSYTSPVTDRGPGYRVRTFPLSKKCGNQSVVRNQKLNFGVRGEVRYQIILVDKKKREALTSPS